MIASTVWNQLVTTLQESPVLSYMKFVYQGRRYELDAQSLPCIQLEPVRDGEIERDFNQTQDVHLTINVFAFSSNNYSEFDKTIVGGVDYKGILDINNDIRAVLQRSYTLGNNVIDVKCQTTEFDTLEDKYPVRGMLLPIRILYRQINEV